MRKAGWLIGAIAAAVLAGSSLGAEKAHAEELGLVGISDELIRLCVYGNELDVIDEGFIEESLEEIETLTVGDVPILASQFVYVDLSGNQYANVRKGPGKEYEIVGRIYGGSVATAIGTSNGWTKLISGNVTGYVLSDFLVTGVDETTGKDAVKLATERNKTKCRVLSTALNLRASASVSARLVHQIPGYSELTILDRGNGSWYKVQYSNGYGKTWTGYVCADYLSHGYYYAINSARIKELESNSLLDNICWPLVGIYSVADYSWCIHPIYKNMSFHNGLDIGGVYGATEVAALDGVVEYIHWGANEKTGGGTYVVIATYTGGIKVQCKYLHCQNVYVSVGQKVVKGQKVASCGASGGATGPHLHFTMTMTGAVDATGSNTVDPMDYLYKFSNYLTWTRRRIK